MDFRIGNGFDVHRLVDNKKLIIGGVNIPFEKGLLGHSDADVLLHSVADALLGAVALGDIGKHFPDTDDKYKDIDSGKLLAYTMQMIFDLGYKVNNIDAVIMAEKPKMAPYIDDMRVNISRICKIDSSRINIKATTTESLGFVGRLEGIATQVVVLLYKSMK